MPTLVEVTTLLLPFLAGFACWALGRLAKRFNMEIDAQYRAYLNQAILTGLSYAASKWSPEAKITMKPDRAHLLDVAGAYVQKRVPAALKHFGVDDTSLAQMVEARANAILES